MLRIVPGAVLGRIDWRVPLVLGWALFLLLPSWRTGFISDDAFNSSAPGSWIHNRSSPFSESVYEAQTWMFLVGRINPLIYFLKNYVFWVFRNLFWYKTALAGATLVNLALFNRLLKRLGASPDLAAFACLLTASLFQFRMFADPLLSFNGLMQLLLACTTLSLEFYHRYLAGGGRRWLAAAVFLYLLAALTYELSYVLWVLHLGLFLTTRPTRSRAASVVPFAAIAGLLFLGCLWLRTLPVCVPGPYALNFEPRAVGATFLKQLIAALPGAYAALDPNPLWQGVFSWRSLAAHPAALGLGFAGGALAVVGLERGAFASGSVRRLLVLGLLLALLPVPTICLVRKYQGELTYGVGYLPVYFQYFGAALAAACGVAALASRLKERRAAIAGLAVAVGALCGGVSALHSEANARVASRLNGLYLHPRLEIEEVLRRGGLLYDAPEGAFVVADPFPWDSFAGAGTNFYCCHTRKRLGKVLPSSGADPMRITALAARLAAGRDGPPVLRVRYGLLPDGRRFAVVGTVDLLCVDANGVVAEAWIGRVRLAVMRLPQGRPDRPFVLHAWGRVAGSAAPEPAALDSRRMRPGARTAHWTVFDVDLPGETIRAESVWLEYDAPALLAAVR